MSKKQNRRAAREAFPKAKAPVPKRGAKYAAKPADGKFSSKTARTKARAATTPTLRRPTWKRAVIQGLILAVIYFLMSYYWLNSKDEGRLTFWGALLIAFAGFVIFAGVAYFVDRYTYNRKLRKLKGTLK
jgi:hypothetical protein